MAVTVRGRGPHGDRRGVAVSAEAVDSEVDSEAAMAVAHSEAEEPVADGNQLPSLSKKFMI